MTCSIPRHMLMIAPTATLHADTRVIDMTNCFCEKGCRVTILCPQQQDANTDILKSLLHANADVVAVSEKGFIEGHVEECKKSTDITSCHCLSDSVYVLLLTCRKFVVAHRAFFSPFLDGIKGPLRALYRRLDGNRFRRLIIEAFGSDVAFDVYTRYRDVMSFDRHNFDYTIRAMSLHRMDPFDCIYVHDLWPLSVGCFLKELWGVTLIYDTHEIATSCIEDLSFVPFMQEAEPWLYRLCDSFLTVNESCADFYKQHFPFIPDPVIFTNGHRFAWEPSADLIPLKRRLGLSDDAVLVAYVGSMHEKTHLDRFIAALPHCPNIHLALLGKGGAIETFKALSDDLQLTNKRVFFLGHVHYKDVFPTIYGADFGLIPNIQTYVNLGLNSSSKLYDYVQTGMPFLSDNGVEIQKILDQFDIGRTMDLNGSVEEITAALNKFAKLVVSGTFKREELQRAKLGLALAIKCC